MKRTAKLFALIFAIVFMLPIITAANAAEINTYDGVYIFDEADILTDQEESSLYEIMTELSELTVNGCVCTDSYNPYSSTSDYAEEIYRELYGRGDGYVFLIDMDKRQIYLFTDGIVHDKVSSARAYEITDNCYSYASDGDYYACVKSALTQIKRLMGGDKLFSSMRIITAVLFGAMFSLFIMTIVVLVSRSPKSRVGDLTESAYSVSNLRYNLRLVKVTKTKHSSSSSGGGSSGGGGGGGGSSGGGGGHAF